MQQLHTVEPELCLNPRGSWTVVVQGAEFLCYVWGRGSSLRSGLGVDLQPLFLQSLKMVKIQSSTVEIESILDSDQRDLIGDFSKVIGVV